ncbi:MAG: DUF2304 domain-containing protein [Candidatus Woesearchaeota archaeon]|jgi:hypothetical protein
MILSIQIIGIIFSAVMIYFAFTSYKRKSFGITSFLLWCAVWIGTLILISFPQTVYGIMETLKIQRTADFIVLVGFAFFAAIIFYLYTTVKKNNYKIEQLVRQLAIKDVANKTKDTTKKNKRK